MRIAQFIITSEVLSSRVKELESVCEDMESEISTLKESKNKDSDNQFTTIGSLQDRLLALKSELLSLEGEKETLLTEVRMGRELMYFKTGHFCINFAFLSLAKFCENIFLHFLQFMYRLLIKRDIFAISQKCPKTQRLDECQYVLFLK